ncbi:iron-sulfur cluster assembly scaffold protein [Donghicola tyrosinivorans]|uniref:NifU-like protein involved in Fe-S cluster formation n=1 Tax=Donghicola tyrosinivorans TaxID=1652492 RepID=A0A2T0WTU1_9RHOB|nr:iron-sulfur cluster assembly scaffold protein [Donghicola tyrosinivorans]PRY90098.1 NifU-like protein involved in Fe-S cluster formation [Donghicola tyrosinivorans]
MSGDNDLMKLYSQRILALAAEVPHNARLESPMASVKKRSPLCGSTVTVDIDVKDGKISNYGAEVKACALGQAAAGVVGQAAVGRTQAEVITARDQLKAMLKEEGPVPDAPFDGLEALLPAKDYKNRHASIMLTLDALAQAFDEAQADQTA